MGFKDYRKYCSVFKSEIKQKGKWFQDFFKYDQYENKMKAHERERERQEREREPGMIKRLQLYSLCFEAEAANI